MNASHDSDPGTPAGAALERLVLVRHAESARNVAKRGNAFFPDDESRRSVRGVADHRTDLTDRGREQARQTGIALRDEFGPFDLAYHSGYRRTHETLSGLLAACTEDGLAPVPVRHHVFLRERDTGYAYDMTTAEAEAAFPWLQDYWRTYGAVFARPPGGESLADVAKRVLLFLDMLRHEPSARRVLVVTHGGTLWMFRMLLEQWTWDEAEEQIRSGTIPQCSVTDYRREPNERRLVAHAVARVFWEQQ